MDGLMENLAWLSQLDLSPLLAQAAPTPRGDVPLWFNFAFFAVILLIQIAIFVLVCFLLQSAQQAVPAEHRKIQPGLIWLLLIPVFNLVWNFFVFLKVPDSYNSYFQSFGQPGVADGCRAIGLAFSICAVASIIPCVNFLTGPASLVLLIIFLVKINDLKKRIEQTTA